MNADPKFQDQLEALSELVRMTIKKRPKIDSPIVTLSKIRRILIVIHSNTEGYLRVKFIFLILALSKKRHKLREQIMKDVVRYESNPFIEGMVVPIRGQKVQLSTLGKDDNVLVNQSTGEIRSTHVTTFKKVDTEQFVKLFTANIALTFELKAAGIKTFNVLVWMIQNSAVSKDIVALDKYSLDSFLKAHSDRKPPISLSMPTFWRGLAELEKAQIIAKHVRPGSYFINPNFIFNGDRISFTTVIERDTSADNKLIYK